MLLRLRPCAWMSASPITTGATLFRRPGSYVVAGVARQPYRPRRSSGGVARWRVRIISERRVRVFRPSWSLWPEAVWTTDSGDSHSVAVAHQHELLVSSVRRYRIACRMRIGSRAPSRMGFTLAHCRVGKQRFFFNILIYILIY